MAADLPWYLRDAILLLVSLVGAALGVFIAVGRRRPAGWLVLAAFVLTAVEPVADLIVWRYLALEPEANWDVLNWTYIFLSTPALLLAYALLLAAVLLRNDTPTAELQKPP